VKPREIRDRADLPAASSHWGAPFVAQGKAMRSYDEMATPTAQPGIIPQKSRDGEEMAVPRV